MMLTEDYTASVVACRQEMAASKPALLLAVFDWFIERVLPACCETTIMHDELIRLLATPHSQK